LPLLVRVGVGGLVGLRRELVEGESLALRGRAVFTGRAALRGRTAFKGSIVPRRMIVLRGRREVRRWRATVGPRGVLCGGELRVLLVAGG
jgi:hypothetical protein